MEALVLRLRRRWRKGDGPELRAWGDAALPRWGKGRCGGAGTTLFAPVGQRRCCVARLILAGLRGKACCGAVCLSGRAGRRAGRTGAGERSRQGMDIHVLRRACRLVGENAPFPRFAARSEDRLSAQPATAIFPRHPAGRTAGSARTRPRDQSLGYPFLRTGPHLLRQACRPMGENAPFPRFAARGEDRAAPPATAIFPRHPAGRTAGSARTRPRVQTLEDPFLGSGCHLPRYPRSPKRRRRQAPARGLAAVCALYRPNRNETQNARPLLVGRAFAALEPTAPAAGTAGPPG